MTSNEAKQILQAYRPSGRDAADPFFAAALAQVRRDPELARWFEREQAHAAVLSAKLRTVKAPAGLRNSIVARAGQSENEPGENRTWWRRPVTFAMAAALAILVSVGSWWGLAPVKGATLDEFAVNFVVRKFLLQKRGPDLAELTTWLATREGPLPRELPAGLASFRALGCRTLVYEGETISLLCFKQDGKEFHLFFARRRELPATSFSPAPLFSERRGHAVVTWSDPAGEYVLVSDADPGVVRRLMGVG